MFSRRAAKTAALITGLISAILTVSARAADPNNATPSAPTSVSPPANPLTSPTQVFRYDTSGTWFKGNTHLHTVMSDGGKTYAEVAQMYADRGYKFLFATDHHVATHFGPEMKDAPVLWLDGVEIGGRDEKGCNYHVVCLGTLSGIERKMPLSESLKLARAQGAFTILAHPSWCGNTFQEAIDGNFDGVEIYNHVCHWLNGKSDGKAHWNAMLEVRPNTLAFCSDDAHIKPEHPGFDGGWIVVNARELSREAIMTAIRAGNYYSSCGPDFKSITCDGEKLHLQTSPIQFVRLVGPDSAGLRRGSFDGQTFTEISLDIPRKWSYVYVEIEDIHGRRAWTNTLFTNAKSAAASGS